MAIKVLLFSSILFTAIGMAAGLAHVFELPHKIHLSRADYLTVQQIYRGWALLGIAVIGALLSSLVLTVKLRNDGRPFWLALAATICIALSLVIFFVFTFPTNQVTHNWTQLPANWEQLRSRWDYSHAMGASLYFAAFNLLVITALLRR